MAKKMTRDELISELNRFIELYSMSEKRWEELGKWAKGVLSWDEASAEELRNRRELLEKMDEIKKKCR